MENSHGLHGPTAAKLTDAQQWAAAFMHCDQDRRRFGPVSGRRLAVDELSRAGRIETDHTEARERGFRGQHPGPQRGRWDLRDIGRRHGGVSPKRSYPDALEPLDDRPTAQRLPDVGGERANVRPLPADDPDPSDRGLDGLDFDRVDDDLSRLPRHLAALAGKLVEAPTLVMNRGVHWGDLADSADEAICQPLNVVTRERRHGSLGETAALEILGVG